MQEKNPYKYTTAQAHWLGWALVISLLGHASLLCLPGIEVSKTRSNLQIMTIGFRHQEPQPEAHAVVAPGRTSHRQPVAQGVNRNSTPPAASKVGRINRPAPSGQFPRSSSPVVSRAPDNLVKQELSETSKPILPPKVEQVTKQSTVQDRHQPVALPAVNDPIVADDPIGPTTESSTQTVVSSASSKPQAAVVTAPAYLDNPRPSYPPLARQRGWQGDVLVRVSVDPNGRVTRTQLQKSSGHRVLDRSALKQIRRWRFRPASRGAMTLAGEVTVPVQFRLRSS